MLRLLIETCVHRRVAVLFATLVVAAFGVRAYFDTPIEAYPDVTNTQVTVITQLPVGAQLGLRGPLGRGWPASAADGRDVLIVAGGLGLPPLRPLIEQVLAERGRYRDVRPPQCGGGGRRARTIGRGDPARTNHGPAQSVRDRQWPAGSPV